ncbi:CoA transferase [Thalassospira tepidiphila]|uniref:CAIB/BAIF family CoA transferase n=3 Tax=Thalassospira TaxID=168934 RepID=A0A853L0Q8_9PROT|nr:CoA transferase [Thalassospira tepidiphila]NJB75078.1 crotonobetainyl-CoA:carnitine CoA-transferase CaiB-like acyl-CoA transferase [Thalassospira tepidiphila]OAZ10469.1 CAIB/BAIF family CoA transferase [Thalassospira tepidiphila MCCC 1A03514]
MPNRFTPQIANALGLSETPAITTIGTDALPSYFAVTELACASIGMAAAMISNWRALETGSGAPVTIDQRLASKWFSMTIRPQGWTLPNVWDPLAGDYQTRDGWIRLHTNAPHHRAAALSVLGNYQTRDDLAMAVREWRSDMLENEIVAANGCAATMHSLEEWQTHPQGISIATDPLICWDQHANTNVIPASIDPARPLRGIRVLDLTRILAGPVAGRFLAAYGADVLRIDPPGWDEGAVIPEVTLGKRCAGLDLLDREDRKLFEELISGADILLHGYRPDALPGLGYDAKTLRAINPALIDVTLSAYGWTGPWAKRRGFDSLLQMSCGVADWGMTHSGSGKPLPLPVQALDHATGYLMAASAVRALIRRATHGEVTTARHSLARTAHMLSKTATPDCIGMIAAETDADIALQVEDTDWGPARRIAFPVSIAGTPHHWDHPAGKLHLHAAHW